MACGPMAEKFVDVRLSEADAELIDFALDLVSDAYADQAMVCLLYTSPSPRDGLLSRMPSSA